MSQMPTRDMSPVIYIHVHLIRIQENKHAPIILTHPDSYGKYHLCIVSSLYFLLKYTSSWRQSLLQIEENIFFDEQIYDDINNTINEIYDKHNHPSNQRTGLSYQNVSLKKEQKQNRMLSKVY